MRKKIILGIVILIALAAVGGAVYFAKNYAVIYTSFCGKHFERNDVTKIMHKYMDDEWEEQVLCTPSLKKFTKLESLWIYVNEDTNYEYLSEMNNLQELTIMYQGYVYYHETLPESDLETLPELPNLKKLTLLGALSGETNFALSDENKYNFSSIENLDISFFTDIDFNSLKHFKNLKKLYLHSMCSLSDMDCFSELQYLENAEFYVYLKEKVNDLFDLSGLKNNKNLKLLTVHNYYDEKFILKDTDCFSDLASIEELKIINISFENIDGLLKMKSLKNLNIDDDCLTEEQIEDLQSRGINVELVQRRSD